MSVAVLSAEIPVLMAKATLVDAFERLLLLSVTPYPCGLNAVVLHSTTALNRPSVPIGKRAERIFWPSAPKHCHPAPAASQSPVAANLAPALFTLRFICPRRCMRNCAGRHLRNGAKSIQLCWRGLIWRCKNGGGGSEGPTRRRR
jgi:hypothetical protein